MMKFCRLSLAFLALFCAFLLPFAVMTQASATQPMTLEQCQTPVPNDDPAQPYLEMKPYENPVYQMWFDDVQANGWHYAFSFEEVNGVPFTVENLTETMYDANGQVVIHWTLEDLSFFDTLRMENGAWQEFGMRIDQPSDVHWVAYQIDGTDDSGNQHSFHCLFELLTENKPVQKPEDFMAEQTRQEGKPFLVLGSDPAPVPVVKDEANADQPYWWQYDVVIENTGDAAFTAVSYNEACFNGANMMVDGAYAAEDVAGWCEEEDCVIDPGERWVISCAMPVQEMTMMGLRMSGTDASGEEMSFTGVIELLHEMKTE